jgi:hypothetical protein
VEALYLVCTGAAGWTDFARFLALALAGNVVGGVVFVAILNHEQVVAGDDCPASDADHDASDDTSDDARSSPSGLAKDGGAGTSPGMAVGGRSGNGPSSARACGVYHAIFDRRDARWPAACAVSLHAT